MVDTKKAESAKPEMSLSDKLIQWINKHPIGSAGAGLTAAGGLVGLSGNRSLATTLAALGLGGIGADALGFTGAAAPTQGMGLNLKKLKSVSDMEKAKAILDEARRNREWLAELDRPYIVGRRMRRGGYALLLAALIAAMASKGKNMGFLRGTSRVSEPVVKHLRFKNLLSLWHKWRASRAAAANPEESVSALAERLMKGLGRRYGPAT